MSDDSDFFYLDPTVQHSEDERRLYAEWLSRRNYAPPESFVSRGAAYIKAQAELLHAQQAAVEEVRKEREAASLRTLISGLERAAPKVRKGQLSYMHIALLEYRLCPDDKTLAEHYRAIRAGQRLDLEAKGKMNDKKMVLFYKLAAFTVAMLTGLAIAAIALL